MLVNQWLYRSSNLCKIEIVNISLFCSCSPYNESKLNWKFDTIHRLMAMAKFSTFAEYYLLFKRWSTLQSRSSEDTVNESTNSRISEWGLNSLYFTPFHLPTYGFVFYRFVHRISAIGMFYSLYSRYDEFVWVITITFVWSKSDE